MKKLKTVLTSKRAVCVYLILLLGYLPFVFIENVFEKDIIFEYCELHYRNNRCSYNELRAFFTNIHIFVYLFLSALSLSLVLSIRKLRKYFKVCLGTVIILGTFLYCFYTMLEFVTMAPYELYNPNTQKTIIIET